MYDLAYWCFLFCGLTALIISGMFAVVTDPSTAGVLGFLVAIPLVLASLGAVVCGIVLSVRLREHRPLGILSGMTVLFLAELLTEAGPVAFFNAVPILYGVGAVAISGAWFLLLRRRLFPGGARD